mmetsp:Transcript_33806/g.71078  ORF Transcript_33806/g.71078 Transcript_33806/m.71078 type:complete len:219 (-) Transcript_33806:317-973(-)
MGWNESRRSNPPQFQPHPPHDHPLRHDSSPEHSQGTKLPQSAGMQKTPLGQRRHPQNGRDMETDNDEIHHGTLPPKSPPKRQGTRDAQRPPTQSHGRRSQQVLWRKNTARQRPTPVRADDRGVSREHGTSPHAVRELPREQETTAGLRGFRSAEYHHEQRVRRSAGIAAHGRQSIRGNGRGGGHGEDTGEDSHGGVDDRRGRLPVFDHGDGQRCRVGG